MACVAKNREEKMPDLVTPQENKPCYKVMLWGYATCEEINH